MEYSHSIGDAYTSKFHDCSTPDFAFISTQKASSTIGNGNSMKIQSFFAHHISCKNKKIIFICS